MSSRKQHVYQIVIEGRLNEDWTGWFAGLDITYTAEGNTVLSGPVRDQAALRGILIKLWDLNLTLLSVARQSSP